MYLITAKKQTIVTKRELFIDRGKNVFNLKILLKNKYINKNQCFQLAFV